MKKQIKLSTQNTATTLELIVCQSVEKENNLRILDAVTRDSEETFFCFWWKRNPNILVTICFLKNS